MKHEPDVEEPVVTMPVSRGATTTGSRGVDHDALALDHALARCGHASRVALDHDALTREHAARAARPRRARAITARAARRAGGATTTVGCGHDIARRERPNGGAASQPAGRGRDVAGRRSAHDAGAVVAT